jgi:uncharacterized protein (TIGR03435 family)
VLLGGTVATLVAQSPLKFEVESLDLRLNWTPAPEEWTAPPKPQVALTPPSDGPSIFTAIQEQLGLKLEPSRGRVEFLVVDGAERPLREPGRTQATNA